MHQSVFERYSWHSEAWNRLFDSGSALHHALLLCGPPGIGKGRLADAIAQRLICESPLTGAESACGTCPSCHWFAGEQHPDFRRVIPEADIETDGDEEATASTEKKKASRQILIAQIRELSDFVFVGSHRGKRRVVLIEPAEAMNPPAANSLLKMLEEPPAGVHFLLVSHAPRSLLPTIRSRCRTLSLPRPDKALAEQWLAGQGAKHAATLLPLAGYAPTLALENEENGRASAYGEIIDRLIGADDPLALAEHLETHLKRKDDPLRMEELVGVVQKWLHDLVSHVASGQVRFFPARTKQIESATRGANLEALLRFSEELIKIKGLANHPLNPRLVLDDLALRYFRAMAGVRK